MKKYNKGDEEQKTLKKVAKMVNKDDDDKEEKEFDENQVKLGMDIEKEHDDLTGGDKRKTRMIVDAHLKEDKKYYTHLQEMEDDQED